MSTDIATVGATMQEHDGHDGAASPLTNIGPGERVASVFAGALLLTSPKMSGTASVLLRGSAAALIARGLTGYCSVYHALGIDHSINHNDAIGVENRRGVHFERSVVINSTPETIFNYWRRFDALPRLIDHLESVTCRDRNLSHWVAKGPLGRRFEWDAELIDERPNEMLAWRSLPGSEVDTAGSLHLKRLPADRGTAVRLNMTYDPPGGNVTATLAGWLGTDVESELHEALRRIKSELEAGELPTTENQSRGAC